MPLPSRQDLSERPFLHRPLLHPQWQQFHPDLLQCLAYRCAVNGMWIKSVVNKDMLTIRHDKKYIEEYVSMFLPLFVCII
jgi:hypothetical protein